MATKMAIFAACLAVCLSLACAIRGERNNIEGGMQPDVVAKTLASVQAEWKAQAALFSDCNSTARSSNSLVNCEDAQKSFTKSCGTIGKAIVQGSGGDRGVMSEYMADVCKQRAMSGWHQLQCKAVALAMSSAMSADKYQNRIGFNSVAMCGKLWRQLLIDRIQEVVREKAEREAAEKKAAEEDAAEEKRRLEAEKKEAARKKTEAAEQAKHEAAAKASQAAAEAKAKAAEAAAKAAKKKAEAEAVAEAARQKMEEFKAAEKAHLAVAKQAKQAKQAKPVQEASHDVANHKDASAVVQPVASNQANVTSAPAKKATVQASKPKAAAETVAKAATKLFIASSKAAPSPAASGSPAGAPGGKIEDLSKDMPLKAQEQGFTGKKVKHEDGKTAAADWQNEYATKAAFLATAAAPSPA